MFCSSYYRTYTYKDPRTKKEYKNLNFWTKYLPIFTEFYNLFYSKKIKIVPQDLSLLTPLALAHWITQDGAKATSGGLYVCTDLFEAEHTIKLSKYLTETFD